MRTDHQAFRPVQAGQRRYLDVAIQILKAIESGSTPLGSRLPSDRVLAEVMGVSRPTVREAVLALEVLGILQVRSGNGTYVVHDGQRSSAIGQIFADGSFSRPAEEILEARLVVEPAAVALAAERATTQALDELEKLLTRADELVDDLENLGEYVRLGLQFHADLLRCCRNAQLATFGAALVDLEGHPLWTILNAQAVRGPDVRRAQIAEHRAILAAVRAGKSSQAAVLLRDHLNDLGAQIYSGGGPPCD